MNDEARRARDREYCARPEVKAKRSEYHRAYRNHPEVKEKLAKYNREYYLKVVKPKREANRRAKDGTSSDC